MNIYNINRDASQFPTRLDKLSDAPNSLFVWGEIPPSTWVAIVGTRRAEPKMLHFAGELAFGLAKHGLGIVSGGALGIDTAAHRGALEANGKTIAVLGSGFDFLFPKKNEELFAAISKSGAVVSEYPTHTPPTRWTFPRRNRLVAALASAVVVVQAPKRSGAMITARIAKEMGVPLGAVPGAPTEPLSSGCNQLIQNGARLIGGVKDVVDAIASDSYCPQLDLLGTVKQVMESPKKAPCGLSVTEQRIWDQLNLDSTHIDDIALKTKLPMSEINAAILNLELSGLIQDLGGRRFIRT